MERLAQPIELIRQFTVCLKTQAGTVLGTGILLDPVHVLTCRHVLEAADGLIVPERLQVIFFGRTSDPRDVVQIVTSTGPRNSRNDVALIEIS